jgi:hypothetical protein
MTCLLCGKPRFSVLGTRKIKSPLSHFDAYCSGSHLAFWKNDDSKEEKEEWNKLIEKRCDCPLPK